MTNLCNTIRESEVTFNKAYDVVIVYPPAEVIREEYDTPDYPNIGIAYIGNFLQKKGKITPALIDARLSRLTLEETVQKICSLNPKILALSAMTHMICTTAKLAARIKRELPHIQIVLGGFHASMLPEQTLKEFPIFDFIINGEGEIAFLKLVNTLLGVEPTNISEIKGVAYRERETVIVNGKGEIPETLDELGEPGWHLFESEDMKKYCRSIPVMAQRGCPFGCTFCSRPYGQKVRKRTPQFVADEIEKSCQYITPSAVSWTENASGLNVSKEKHFKGKTDFSKYRIRFFDETFTVNKKHTMDLCDEILSRKLDEKIEWRSLVHANTVDDEIATLMRKAGCVHVGFGVESGDPTILANMKKGITKEKLLRARNVLKRANIRMIAFFIFGHPYETRRSIWRTICFAIRLNADETAFGVMVPYPGTEIWELALAGKGGYKKLSPSWDDYNKQLGNAVDFEGISRREVEFYQLFASGLIYLVNFRFKDLIVQFFNHFELISGIILKILSKKPRSQNFPSPNYRAYL